MLPPGFFSTGGINTLVVYNDSLYVGGAFVEDGPPPLSCFAKWVGGDQTFGCGTYVGVEESTTSHTPAFTVHPSPTTGMLSLSISLPSSIPLDITILDATGRSVLVYQNWYSGALDVSRLASGAYSVVASTGGRGHVYHARFIRE